MAKDKKKNNSFTLPTSTNPHFYPALVHFLQTHFASSAASQDVTNAATALAQFLTKAAQLKEDQIKSSPPLLSLIVKSEEKSEKKEETIGDKQKQLNGAVSQGKKRKHTETVEIETAEEKQEGKKDEPRPKLKAQSVAAKAAAIAEASKKTGDKKDAMAVDTPATDSKEKETSTLKPKKSLKKEKKSNKGEEEKKVDDTPAPPAAAIEKESTNKVDAKDATAASSLKPKKSLKKEKGKKVDEQESNEKTEADAASEAVDNNSKEDASKKKKKSNKAADLEEKENKNEIGKVEVDSASENPKAKRLKLDESNKDNDASSPIPPNDKPSKADKKSVQKNAPFQRIKTEEVTFKDPRLMDNSFLAKGGAKGSWGEKAYRDLVVTQGKSFRYEKTKKKRGSYRGGVIDTGVHSIKFDSDNE